MTETTKTNEAGILAPRDGTKLAKLVSLLSRKSGVTLDKASEALGWQRHTTSATLTGLRKRGYSIERVDKENKPSIYVIAANATQT